VSNRMKANGRDARCHRAAGTRTDRYYIVRRCQVVDKPPTTKEMSMVNPDGTSYTTRTEAMNATKTVKVCE
jgi:hypothetical protein